MSWGSGSTASAMDARVAPRIQMTTPDARLRAAIMSLASRGDIDSGPLLPIDADAGGTGRTVAGQPDPFRRRRVTLGQPDHRTIRGSGSAGLRGDLPDGPEAFGDHVVSPVVDQELHGHPRARGWPQALGLQDGSQADSSDQGLVLGQRRGSVAIEGELDSEGMLFEREGRK